MMADLMRNHISLRKVAGLILTLQFRLILLAANAHLRTHILKESGIDIDLLVCRAIERPHRRLRRAAAGIDCAAEHHQFWRRILRIQLCFENF